MASLGNGNAWRQSGEGFDPVERGDVSTDDGVAQGDALTGYVSDGANEFTPAGYAFDYPKTAWRHALCRGCYCSHSPPCPPCECAFHNPNIP